MAERIESLISKEALTQFQALKTLTDENVSAFEKLVARAVALNKELGSAKSFKEISQGMKQASEAEQELIKKSEELQASLARLQKMYDEQAKKLAELSTKASETRKNYGSIGDSFADVGNKLDSSDNPFKKAIANLVSLNNQLKQNREAQKTLQGQKSIFQGMDQRLPDVQRGLAEINKREQELVAEEKLLRAEITATNKEIRQRISLNQADANTREFIKQQITDLKRERDFSVNINTEEGMARLAEINQEIDRLNKILEQTTDNLEQRKINIGNYPGAAKILEKALEDVKKKMDDLNDSGRDNGDVIRQLQREEELLARLLESQATGFANLTAELKANERALQDLKRAGLEESEAYQELFVSVAKAKDELKSFKKELATRGSGELFLNGAIQAAQTLAGVYGIAQGAAALFGDENEELQKTFVKLQAVLTILTSLEALNNAIKKESALRTSLNVALQKVSVVQTNLQAAAESKNIIVRYAAIAAQKTLNLVMSAAGGPILAIIGLIALMVLSLKSFASEAGKTAKSMQELNDLLEINSKLNEESAGAIQQATDVAVAELKSRFASESEIRMRIFAGLKAELKERQDFNDRNAALFDQAEKTIRKYIGVREYGYSANGQIIQKEKKLNEEEQKELDAAIALRDRYNENQQKQFELEHRIKLTRLQFLRENAIDVSELTKRELELEKISLERRAMVQNEIASNDRKTLRDRVEALRQFASLQERIINTDARIQRTTPGLSPTQLAIIEQRRAAAIQKARIDSNKQIEQLTRQFAEREAAAQFAIAKSNIEAYAQMNLRIVEDQGKSIEERLRNNKEYFDRQKVLIEAQRDFELRNELLTETERIAIQKRADNELLFLQLDFIKKSNEIQSQGLEQSLQFSINRNNRRRDILLGNLAAERQAGLISEEEYQKKRSDIEFRYAQSDLEILINGLRNQVDARRKAGEDVSELEAQLAEYQKQLRENDLEHTKQTEEQKFQARVEKLNKLKEITGNVFGVIAELAQIQFDTEKARVEEEIANIERKRDAELAAINASALSEQEKADKIQILEAKVQAQKEQQERRLKQIEADRARFERLLTIQRIISDTAAAVVAALGDKSQITPIRIALAATVGALGAAQLARVIATPLPRFAHGTDDAPGGLSVVGDAYRSELVKEPSGKMWVTPNVPTVMNVPKHSIVYPDARQALESGLVVNRHGRLVQAGTDTSKIEQKLDRLTSVIKNKPVLNMKAGQDGLTAVWRYGANWIGYVEDSVRF